ncbi:MAG: hypothetical protein ACOY90_08560 [Candidatus Zhuqueibacterota bacterium]
MNRKQKIEQEIEKTLGQFERAERLPSNPYFHTRVQARLNETPEPSGVLKPIFLAVLLTLNILTAVYFIGGGTSQSTARSDLLSEFAQEIGLEESETEFINIQ